MSRNKPCLVSMLLSKSYLTAVGLVPMFATMERSGKG